MQIRLQCSSEIQPAGIGGAEVFLWRSEKEEKKKAKKWKRRRKTLHLFEVVICFMESLVSPLKKRKVNKWKDRFGY